MNKQTRKLTLSALFSALAVVSLFFAVLWPSGELALAAFSSIFVAAAIIEEGISAGVYVYVCGSVLSLILFPGMPSPLFFAVFFGYYPVIKSFIERVRFAALQWVLKLAVFNCALAAIYFFVKDVVFSFGDYSPGLLVICVVGSALLALFDYGFSKVIWLYMYQVHSRFKR